MSVSEIAPGWYKDPAEPTTQRYWTGEEWIGDPLPVGETPPAGPPIVHRAAPPAPPPAPVALAPAPPATPPTPAPAPPPATSPASPAPGAGGPPPGWYPGVPQPGWRPGTPLPPGGVLVPVRINPHGYPIAPLGLRPLARLIDIGLLLLLNLVANGWLIYTVVSDYTPYFKASMKAIQAGQNTTTAVLPDIPGRTGVLTSIVIPLIVMVLWWVYEVPATARTGQTFGKRMVGIKVMALESTNPLGIPRAFRRWNPLGGPVILWSCFGLGFLFQFIDSLSTALGGPLNLALHDRSAATVVVHSGRRGHEITPQPPLTPTGEPR